MNDLQKYQEALEAAIAHRDALRPDYRRAIKPSAPYQWADPICQDYADRSDKVKEARKALSDAKARAKGAARFERHTAARINRQRACAEINSHFSKNVGGFLAPQKTICDLQREFAAEIQRIAPGAHVEHGAGCEKAGKLLYGHNTTVNVPEGTPVGPKLRQVIEQAVTRFYAPVSYSIVEKHLTQLSWITKPNVFRQVICIHNDR